MIEYTPEEKRIIIAILIAIMEADTIIDPRETNFLDNVFKTFDITSSVLDALDEVDINEITGEFKKFEPAKKVQAIELFLAMARCDGYADPREIEIINRLGD